MNYKYLILICFIKEYTGKIKRGQEHRIVKWKKYEDSEYILQFQCKYLRQYININNPSYAFIEAFYTIETSINIWTKNSELWGPHNFDKQYNLYNEGLNTYVCTYAALGQRARFLKLKSGPEAAISVVSCIVWVRIKQCFLNKTTNLRSKLSSSETDLRLKNRAEEATTFSKI
jgi:hypothetical protein